MPTTAPARELAPALAGRSRLRAFTLLLLVVALCCSLMLQAQRAEAYTAGSVVPVSVTTIVRGGSAAAAGALCTATVACGAVAIGGALACMVWCDDLLLWATGKITGVQNAPRNTESKPNPTFWSTPTPAEVEGGTPHFQVSSLDHGWQQVAVMVTRTCSGTSGTKTYPEYQGGNIPSTQGRDNPTVDPNDPYFRIPVPSSGFGPLCPEAGYGTLSKLKLWMEGRVNGKDGYAYWSSQDPDKTGGVTATVTCKNGAQTASGSATFTNAASIIPPSCDEILPGSHRTGVAVADTATGQPLGEARTDLSPYPDCQNTSAPCALRPVSNPDGTTTCKWGPYTMPSSDCDGLPPPSPQPSASPTPTSSPAPTRAPQPAPATAPTTGGSPWDPATVPAQDGTTTTRNADGSITTTTRSTGPDGTTTVTSRTVYPDGSTVTSTRTYPPGETSPTTTTHVYTPPTPPTGSGSSVDPDGRSCISGAFSWNPVDWVYVPVKCALSWAFVPSPSNVAGVQAAGSDLAGRVPFSYIGDGVSWAGGLANPGQECFTVNVSKGSGDDLKALSTCEPGPFESWLMNNRGLMSVAMWAGFLLPMSWWAWRQYAPGSTGVA